MSVHKIRDAKGVACGCEYTVKGSQELITKMCQEHEMEFTVRHAAAVASCSHVHRQPTDNRDLIGG
jgi:hypothetical protein